MPVAITQVFSSQAQDPPLGPDDGYDIFELAFTGDYPGAPGEPLDLSTFFREVRCIGAIYWITAPNGLVPYFERVDDQNARARWFAESDGGANTPLAELPNAAYPGGDFTVRVQVWGRPITAAA